MEILGVDIGGSGIKGAPVDTATGRLLGERCRIETPEGARPQPMADVMAEVARSFNWKGPIGVGFPAAVRHGTVMTAANISKKWLGVNAAALFSQTTGSPVCVLNDADAAGMAEMRFGAGKDRSGVVMVVTIGTGLGTAIFVDGVLLPNTELGHIEINGEDAEVRASEAARKRDDISWEKWAGRFDAYLRRLEGLFWPDLFILGGGGSKKFEKFAHLITVQTEVVPAQTLNEAGIIGAALAARTLLVP